MTVMSVLAVSRLGAASPHRTSQGRGVLGTTEGFWWGDAKRGAELCTWSPEKRDGGGTVLHKK